MSIQKNKFTKKQVLFIIAICFAVWAIMSDSVIVTIYSSLLEAFPDASSSITDFILTGSTLTGAIFALVSGTLSKRFENKTLVLIGFAIITVGTVFGAWIINPYYIAVMRGVFGIGNGIYSAAALALIADVFSDENQRGTVIGIYGAAQALGGVLLSLSAGFVATMGWTYVFRIYLVYIIFFILIVLFVPGKKGREQKDTAEQEQVSLQTSENEKMPWKKLTLFAGGFFFLMICGFLYYQISVIITENGLGGTVQTGFASSIGTLGQFISCLVFGAVFAKLKRATLFTSIILMIIGYVLLFIAGSTSLTAVYIAAFIYTFGMGFMLTYYNTVCTMIVPAAQVGIATSIVVFVSNIGAFMTSYFCTFLVTVMNTDIRGTLPVLLAIMVVGAVLSFVMILKSKNMVE